ncbi:MAG TPA: FecR domain-containing protein [Gammaproteobacteria bacterium]
MANIVRFRARADAEEEAAAWIARADKGLSAEERAQLEEWLAADPRHRRAFRELGALWEEADALAELAELFPLDRAVRARRRRHYGLAAAALIAVVTAGLAVGWWGERLWGGGPELAARFETPVGGRLTENLPDGSVVMLNTDTAITVEYSGDARTVRLERGEAHFDVARDPSRPFDVHAGGRVVRAVGTAFNVRLRAEGGLEVTVTEGGVELVPAAKERAFAAHREPPPATAPLDTTVTAGQVAIVDAADERAEPRVFRLEPADLDIRLAWQRGMLIFRGEPLEEMLREVARYTNTRFVLTDPELAQVRVGGYFRAGDVEGLLVALRENLDIESERLAGNRIALRAAD